ncbi:MAG: hypothetical protein ACLFVU_01655 [Phycisphaerae bacterium]
MGRANKGSRNASRVWRVLAKASAWIALALATLYVTLPFWSPPLLKHWLVDTMQQQMGVKVEIDEVSADWAEGVQIRGMRIYNPPEFGPEPMVEIKEIRSEFSPIDYLLHDRLEWTEISQPHVLFRTNEQGDVNLAPLTRLDFEVNPERLTVSDAEVTIRLADQPQRLTVHAANVQFVKGQTQLLGQVTVSAELTQPEKNAPLSLKVDSGSRLDTLAEASLYFNDVKLDQIPIPEALGLQIDSLGGTLDGWIDLHVDRGGVVDRIKTRVEATDFAARSSTGPNISVPGRSARLELSARYDPMGPGGGTLELVDSQVELPGLEVSASGAASLAALGGSWEAIHSLSLKGTIRPSRLAEILGRKQSLPGGYDADGPVTFDVEVDHSGPKLRLTAEANATPVRISRNGELLKEAGAPLLGKVVGVLDDRNFRFTGEQTLLRIGRNRFEGRGSIADVRTVAGSLVRTEQVTYAGVLAALSEFDWRGKWVIEDLKTLRELLPEEAPLEQIALDGRLEGTLNLTGGEDPEVRLSATAEKQTQLTVGDSFRKPLDSEATARLSGLIDNETGAIRNVSVDLSVGPSSLHLDKGLLQVTGASEGRSVRLEGKFELRHVGGLLRASPRMTAAGAASVFRGSSSGSFRFESGPDAISLHGQADLKKLGIDLGKEFRKQPGPRADATVNLAWNNRKGVTPAGGTLDVAYVEPRARLDVSGRIHSLPETLAHLPSAVLDVKMNVDSAQWLIDTFGWAAEYAEPDSLTGKVQLQAKVATMHRSVVINDLDVDADALAFRTASDPARVKKAGTTLRVDGSLAMAWNDSETRFRVRSLRIAYADSHLAARGTGVLDRGLGAWLRGGLAHLGELDGKVEGTLRLGDPLERVVPELTAYRKTHGLDGAITISAELGRSGADLTAELAVDVGKLTVKNLPLRTFSADAPEITLRKLAETKAHLGAVVELREDLRRLAISDVDATIGPLSLTGSLTAVRPLAAGDGAQPLQIVSTKAKVSSDDLSRLRTILPHAQPYKLAGAIELAAGYSALPGRQATQYLTLEAADARFVYRNKPVTLNGQVLVENVVLQPQRDPQLETLEADLQFSLGDTDGYLQADISGVPKAPRGSLRVLATTVNLIELNQWATGYDLTEGGYDLPAPRRRELAKTARLLRDRLTPLIRDSRLDATVHVDKLISYDASVQQKVELNSLLARATTADGKADLSFSVDFNGGLMNGSYEIRHERDSYLARWKLELVELLGTDAFQPQMAKFFPGNNVYGTFSRQERLQAPLVDVLAGSLDTRYPVRPEGSARSRATAGVVVGRAGPEFITRIFPGLNLTTYEYEKMTAFAKFEESGQVTNEMIFEGKKYDLYMEGHTTPANVAHYTVGLILPLRRSSADWQRRWRLGRLPLLNFKGRIARGKFVDQEVSYPWPNETLGAIFVQSNPVYRLWINRNEKEAKQK